MQENENNDKDTTFSEKIEGEDLKIYEIGYLLVPSTTEEEVPTFYGNLRELISSLNGKMISDEIPIMINLAYTMQKTVQNIRNKYDTAYFGWMKFYIDGEGILNLKKKLDLDPKIIRFLITKTIKENTIAAKRFIHRDISRKKTSLTKGNEHVESTPIDKEEIDKEIDAMVAI